MGIGSGLWAKMKARIGHLVTGHGAKGEIGHVRNELAEVFGALQAITVEEYNPAPPAASVNSIKTASATVMAVKTYLVTDFNGTIGGNKMFPPRNVSVTTGGATATHAPASVTFNGLDAHGNLLSETIPGTNAGAGTYLGAKCFAQITSISSPAATGVDATVAFGNGAVLGLSQTPKLRTGQTLGLVRNEIMDGAVISPVTGVLTAPATNLPFGAYTPAAAPNGTHLYSIEYEFDASVDVDALL